jgi:hypothetical protein
MSNIYRVRYNFFRSLGSYHCVVHADSHIEAVHIVKQWVGEDVFIECIEKNDKHKSEDLCNLYSIYYSILERMVHNNDNVLV